MSWPFSLANFCLRHCYWSFILDVEGDALHSRVLKIFLFILVVVFFHRRGSAANDQVSMYSIRPQPQPPRFPLLFGPIEKGMNSLGRSFCLAPLGWMKKSTFWMLKKERCIRILFVQTDRIKWRTRSLSIPTTALCYFLSLFAPSGFSLSSFTLL